MTTSLPRNQKGAVLVVALIMLLLLTILGVSSMQNTSLQEVMAGNTRDHTVAFESAELALREAEAKLPTVPALQNMPAATTSFTALSGVDEVVKQPAYRITPIPGVTIQEVGGSLEAGQPVTVGLVRIEAQGFGISSRDDAGEKPASTVNLSSIYLKR